MEGEGQVVGINFQNHIITIRQDNGEVVDVSIDADTSITSRDDGQKIENPDKIGVGSQVVIKRSEHIVRPVQGKDRQLK